MLRCARNDERNEQPSMQFALNEDQLAVRDMVHGRAVKNKEALANPEALELFRDLPQLAN